MNKLRKLCQIHVDVKVLILVPISSRKYRTKWNMEDCWSQQSIFLVESGQFDWCGWELGMWLYFYGSNLPWTVLYCSTRFMTFLNHNSFTRNLLQSCVWHYQHLCFWCYCSNLSQRRIVVFYGWWSSEPLGVVITEVNCPYNWPVKIYKMDWLKIWEKNVLEMEPKRSELYLFISNSIELFY